VRIGALVDSTLVARKLAPHRRILVASPAYLNTRPPPQEPGHLEDHQCLLFALQPTGAWYYLPTDYPVGDPVEVAVKGHLRANDSEALREAALAGLGIALLPTWLVGADVREKRLVSVLPDYEWLIAPGPERAIWAVYPPKRVVSPKVKAFIAFLSQRFGQPRTGTSPSHSRPQIPRFSVRCNASARSPRGPFADRHVHAPHLIGMPICTTITCAWRNFSARHPSLVCP
jgi:DNA-binding transcriptional LysR family regulator